MENLKKENEKSRLRIEKLEDEIISKTPKPDQARMKKTLGEIELDSKLSIRVRLNLLVENDHFFKKSVNNNFSHYRIQFKS